MGSYQIQMLLNRLCMWMCLNQHTRTRAHACVCKYPYKITFTISMYLTMSGHK